MAWYTGAPNPSSYVPLVQSSFSDRMTYFQRMKNTLGFGAMMLFYEHMLVTPETQLFRKHFGQDFPNLADLARQSPLVFINSIEFIDFPRPILHKIVYMGGIGMGTSKKLEEKWETLMNSSIDGVVLLSMGSVVNSTLMPHEYKMSFLNSFGKFPTYTFIWKYESNDFPEASGHKNVHLSPWVPQTDLLSHPKMRAFITHGGQNSYMESALAGIPMISIPLFADQYSNMRKAERHGMGIGLEKTELCEATVSVALEKILKNSSYLMNAQRIASMMKKRPVKSEDLTVKWVEFLAEYKELPNLEIAGNDLNLIQYYLFDVIVGIFCCLFLFVYFFYRIAYCVLCSLCCRRCQIRKNKAD